MKHRGPALFLAAAVSALSLWLVYDHSRGDSLSTDEPILGDSASGLGMAHVEWPGDGGTWVYEGPARGWYVMRAVMTALGLDSVADTNQLMNTGYFTRPGLGAGDLDGLHTMYKNIPCPPIPD